jgi:hypothetical protein
MPSFPSHPIKTSKTMFTQGLLAFVLASLACGLVAAAGRPKLGAQQTIPLATQSVPTLVASQSIDLHNWGQEQAARIIQEEALDLADFRTGWAHQLQSADSPSGADGVSVSGWTQALLKRWQVGDLAGLWDFRIATSHFADTANVTQSYGGLGLRKPLNKELFIDTLLGLGCNQLGGSDTEKGPQEEQANTWQANLALRAGRIWPLSSSTKLTTAAGLIQTLVSSGQVAQAEWPQTTATLFIPQFTLTHKSYWYWRHIDQTLALRCAKVLRDDHQDYQIDQTTVSVQTAADWEWAYNVQARISYNTTLTWGLRYGANEQTGVLFRVKMLG